MTGSVPMKNATERAKDDESGTISYNFMDTMDLPYSSTHLLRLGVVVAGVAGAGVLLLGTEKRFSVGARGSFFFNKTMLEKANREVFL